MWSTVISRVVTMTNESKDGFYKWVKMIGILTPVAVIVSVMMVRLLATDFVTKDELSQREVVAEKLSKERQDAINQRLDGLTITIRDIYNLLLTERQNKK